MWCGVPGTGTPAHTHEVRCIAHTCNFRSCAYTEGPSMTWVAAAHKPRMLSGPPPPPHTRARRRHLGAPAAPWRCKPHTNVDAQSRTCLTTGGHCGRLGSKAGPAGPSATSLAPSAHMVARILWRAAAVLCPCPHPLAAIVRWPPNFIHAMHIHLSLLRMRYLGSATTDTCSTAWPRESVHFPTPKTGDARAAGTALDPSTGLKKRLAGQILLNCKHSSRQCVKE